MPNEWDVKTCNDVAAAERNAIVGGPFGSDLVSTDYVNEGIPVIRGSNMGGRLVAGPYVYVSPAKAKSLRANLARPGDIVFTQRGTLGQVSLVPENAFPAYLISQSQMKLTVDRRIADVGFLFHAFSGAKQQDILRIETIQTGVPHINLGILRRLPIQIPPLSEQEKIAEILTTSDEAGEQLARLIAAKKSQKRALMQQLLTGKKRLPGFSGKWQRLKIGALFKEVSRPVDWDDRHQYSLLSVRRRSGGVFLREKLRGEQIATKAMFVTHAGDFLISKMQVLHGATGLVPKELDGCHISGSYIALRPKASDAIDPAFFARLSEQHEFRHLTYLCSYGVHIEKMTFNLEWFLESTVLLPVTVSEQQAIANVIATADSEIALLEQKHVAYELQKRGLMQKLLTGQIRVKV
jgi:restriction endonuclease S subunit